MTDIAMHYGGSYQRPACHATTLATRAKPIEQVRVVITGTQPELTTMFFEAAGEHDRRPN